MTYRFSLVWGAFLCFLLLEPNLLAQSPAIAKNIAQIKGVKKEGKGSSEAAQAWKVLTENGPDSLVEILSGFDDANPTANNWLRAAVDTIAERTVGQGKSLPSKDLEAFLRDTKKSPIARRIAYEWIVRVDAKSKERLLPQLVNDPGSELRRDAVEHLLKEAKKVLESDEKKALEAYRKILEVARDRDQVVLVGEQLKKLGMEIDLTRHMGFITQWAVVGPFDNTKGVGFKAVYPPEKGVDLQSEYEGKETKKVKWQEIATKEKFGLVDLTKPFGPLKGAVSYAYAEVTSPETRPVQIRAGSNNAVRIFLNGKEVFFREEYHHGIQMDQHSGNGVLKAGKNEVLIKICQNEQTESWAQLWSFQLRICDSLGGAVPFKVVTKKVGE